MTSSFYRVPRWCDRSVKHSSLSRQRLSVGAKHPNPGVAAVAEAPPVSRRRVDCMRPTDPRDGIPGHYTRLAKRRPGLSRLLFGATETAREKEEFLQELRNISNTGNYLIGEGALRAIARMRSRSRSGTSIIAARTASDSRVQRQFRHLRLHPARTFSARGCLRMQKRSAWQAQDADRHARYRPAEPPRTLKNACRKVRSGFWTFSRSGEHYFLTRGSKPPAS